jgi:hypothetical protein
MLTEPLLLNMTLASIMDGWGESATNQELLVFEALRALILVPVFRLCRPMCR